jgi:hypothetical protein
LVGSVKKWSSWYFKEKIIKKEGPGSPSSFSRASSEDPSSGESTAYTKQAPLPHEFPPELMHTLSDPDPITNPYAPPPEMKIPVKYPSPGVRDPPTLSVRRKPVGSSPSPKPLNQEDISGIEKGLTREDNERNKTGELQTGVERSSESLLEVSNGTNDVDGSNDVDSTNDVETTVTEIDTTVEKINDESVGYNSSSDSPHSSFHPSPVFQLQNSPGLGETGTGDDVSIRSYSLNSSVPIQIPKRPDPQQPASSAASVSSHSSSTSSDNSTKSRRVSVVALSSEHGREGIVLQSSPPKVSVSTTTSTASHFGNNGRRYHVKRKQVGSAAVQNPTTLAPSAVTSGIPQRTLSRGSSSGSPTKLSEPENDGDEVVVLKDVDPVSIDE